MFGFGVRTSQVFTSRWKALLWAAGVLLTAYMTVPAAEDSPSSMARARPSPQTSLDAVQQQRDAQAAIDALSHAGD